MMQNVVLKIDGMHCQSCVKSVERAILQVEGVHFCEVNIDKDEIFIDYDEALVGVEELKNVIEAVGFLIK